MKLISTGQYAGSHGAEIMRDETDKRYLVKRQDEFRTDLDVAISQIQDLADMDAPLVTKEILDGEPVAVQEWIENTQPAFSGWNFVSHNLVPAELAALTREFVFDWMISNHDAHPGQFLRTDYGLIVGIDKGQAFKHFGKDRIAIDYHPNAAYGEREPIYNTLMRDGILTVACLTPDVLGFIDRLYNINDREYARILAPYANAVHGSMADIFISQAVARKNELLEDITRGLVSNAKQ